MLSVTPVTEKSLSRSNEDEPQMLEIMISDGGPGITNLDEIFEGRYRSETGLGLGIVGTKRLMDHFDITSSPKGTVVTMGKTFPSAVPSFRPGTRPCPAGKDRGQART